ncbi:MAG: hypothetical protein HOP11_13465 [Saprospiraceae bacterium]|nr:hypothetical protein [Saprospiraceae bacterium]
MISISTVFYPIPQFCGKSNNMYNLSLDKLMWRFYLMMGIVIAAFYLGIPWLSILSVPVLLSALAGWSFKKKAQAAPRKKEMYEFNDNSNMTQQYL